APGIAPHKIDGAPCRRYTVCQIIRTLFDGRDWAMTEVTQLMLQIAQGNDAAAEQLLPLVYSELRRLAARRLSHERPSQTLDATGLVHEAYLRLAGGANPQSWQGKSHFLAAA